MTGTIDPVTPRNVPTLKTSTSSRQTSIAGFFQKKVVSNENASALPQRRSPGKTLKHSSDSSIQSLTPAPSSDAPTRTDPAGRSPSHGGSLNTIGHDTGLPSPSSPKVRTSSAADLPSPSRRGKKHVVYKESDSDEEEDIVLRGSQARRNKNAQRIKRSRVQDDDEDVFESSPASADESDRSSSAPKKRKLSSKASKPSTDYGSDISQDSLGELVLPTVSTAQAWKFDPNAAPPPAFVSNIPQSRRTQGQTNSRSKSSAAQNDERYEWLKSLQDIDRNPIGHADYDPRTVYIPPKAWAGFSPFETQYWKIKQKFMDTIVFFKKGKFYELYEQDATIGHQLFDLKLTDRVNMRMVGVPEMSLGHWATQFVAAGYKIARVDQQESALAKEMRERDGKASGPQPKAKVIERKLACVLTGGTLVDATMLQDDMSTYCVAIKESEKDGAPEFGISFVDAATGQFFVTTFLDDVDYTKFETLIAQIRPQELILEKGHISAGTNRILKNNTQLTTIRNEIRPGKEFWTAEKTTRELEAAEYFVSEDHKNIEAWPSVLREALCQDLLLSSFGALVYYLRTLQIERELLTLGNVSWYDPIRKATSLVLDGKTLINLEIFANNFDSGSDGTLFGMLNHCITPFGKRLFKQWVCHPLMDTETINARLDAVESLNADTSVRDKFVSQLSKLPDLERLISRIHAGSCRPQDFVKVLEGFEQIDYTMQLVGSAGGGSGIIGHLIETMPDMTAILQEWKETFDHEKARTQGLLIPERGIEETFDASQACVDGIKEELEAFLKRVRRDLGSNSIEFRDNGKEIYQIEVPVKVKGVPKSWDQMSATQQVKRYYNPELRALVRRLQESQETHGQVVKEVSGRLFARFDVNYSTWLAAVRIVSHLDCLISLARASAALGSCSSRPTFLPATVESRSEISFTDLRHPCMLASVDDFIPNDIRLGGSTANINLLTGANAAGKSTILRMTCIAVIMAQIGCFVPARTASLTPVDRIMSRLGANDNIFAAQSTFFVELSETKKILSEATPRSLVILDELGRGTSSYDGVAVAEAVLHHVATHIGCIGFFATHYHSLAQEFATHPEISNMRMQIQTDAAARRVTFLYKLERGVAEGSFGMHCASMCGIPPSVVSRAEEAAKAWEHTSKLTEQMGKRSSDWIPLGMASDVAWLLRSALALGDDGLDVDRNLESTRGLDVLRKAIE